MANKKISVVIPVYNEQSILTTLHERLSLLARGKPYDFEFIFISDGSTDGTLPALIELSRRDARVVVLDLTRNFGQHPALTAGIDNASGDAVILMDADMEDNPDHVAEFIAAWEEGWEVVYGTRGKRKAGLLRRWAFGIYHAINSRLEQHMPMAGTFCLMDRRVVDVLRLMPEHNRYIPGLRSWTGFRQKGIVLDRGARYDDSPRVSWVSLVRLAVNSYVSFSKMPLKLASAMGLFFSMVGFAAIIFVVLYQLVLGFKLTGWASLIVTIIFASGLQLLCLGILGEYVAQILDEAKARPLYLIRTRIRGGTTEEAAPSRRTKDYPQG